jgi:hypothetical protein
MTHGIDLSDDVDLQAVLFAQLDLAIKLCFPVFVARQIIVGNK